MLGDDAFETFAKTRLENGGTITFKFVAELNPAFGTVSD